MVHEKSQNRMIAAELARFGARTFVIEQLTGLATSTARKVILDSTGGRHICGLLPYCSDWYEERPERLMHCALFLRLFEHDPMDRSGLPGRVFLNAYTRYRNMMNLDETTFRSNATLSINQVYIAIHLLSTGELSHRTCKSCGSRYVEGRDRSAADTCRICHTP